MRVQRLQKGEGLEDAKATQAGADRAEATRGGRAGGATIADACRRLEVSEATYHRWRKQYSGAEFAALDEAGGFTSPRCGKALAPNGWGAGIHTLITPGTENGGRPGSPLVLRAPFLGEGGEHRLTG